MRISTIEMVLIGELKPHPKNPNVHSEDQIERLATIIEFQGWRYPVKVSLLSGFVTSGHGRIEAAKLRGWTHLPVSYQEYDTEEQEYADIVSDNAIAEWAQLDLASINREMIAFGPELDIDLLGIKNFVLEPAEILPPGCDEDHVPSRTDTISKPGDIWRMGKHRVMCGSSILMDDVSRLMGEDKADMVWTDPPYNVAYEGKTKDALTIENDAMSADAFYQFLYDAYINLFMYTKPGGAIYVAHADSEGMNFRKAMVDAGWLLKQCLIWVKQTLVMGRQDYHWKHEPILYGWAPGHAHNWFTDRKQTTVLEFNRPTRSTDHPTMKPVELVEYCIGNSCVPGGIVLDLFGGSGTTMIACEKLNRGARLMELDPKYVDVIVARWQKYTGQKAELIVSEGESVVI